jgi:hypothetical protein
MNKLYIKKIKKILEKNTFYENKYMGDAPTPYVLIEEKEYYKIVKYLLKLLEVKNEK